MELRKMIDQDLKILVPGEIYGAGKSEIKAGGAGSGCHGPNCGRHAGGTDQSTVKQSKYKAYTSKVFHDGKGFFKVTNYAHSSYPNRQDVVVFHNDRGSGHMTYRGKYGMNSEFKGTHAEMDEKLKKMGINHDFTPPVKRDLDRQNAETRRKIAESVKKYKGAR